MDDSSLIEVEVAYALPEKRYMRSLKVESGTTIAQAIERSGLSEEIPGLDVAQSKVGIFGKIKPATTVLQSGDRVEIYRPLIADPKEVRRKRAAEGKVMKKGAGAEKQPTKA